MDMFNGFGEISRECLQMELCPSWLSPSVSWLQRSEDKKWEYEGEEKRSRYQDPLPRLSAHSRNHARSISSCLRAPMPQKRRTIYASVCSAVQDQESNCENDFLSANSGKSRSNKYIQRVLGDWCIRHSIHPSIQSINHSIIHGLSIIRLSIYFADQWFIEAMPSSDTNLSHTVVSDHI